MNDPFESYKLYNALKLHFESKYDAVKYNYKTSVTPNSFFKRKDKYFFAKLAKTHGKHLKEFYISQFINGQKYVGDMMDAEAEQHYVNYKKIQENSISNVGKYSNEDYLDNAFEKLKNISGKTKSVDGIEYKEEDIPF